MRNGLPGARVPPCTRAGRSASRASGSSQGHARRPGRAANASCTPNKVMIGLTSLGARSLRNESMFPDDTSMGTLRTRKRRRSGTGSSIPRLHLDLHALVAKQLEAGSPVDEPTPVAPEEPRIPDDERMEQDAH